MQSNSKRVKDNEPEAPIKLIPASAAEEVEPVKKRAILPLDVWLMGTSSEIFYRLRAETRR
jgi:hypothetical protein